MDSNDSKELNQLHLAYRDIGFKEGLAFMKDSGIAFLSDHLLIV